MYRTAFLSQPIKNIISKMSLLASANLIGVLVSFLSAPAITYFFLPHDMAHLNTFIAILAPVTIFSTLGVEYGIMTAQDKKESRHLALIGLISTAVVCALAFIIYLIVKKYGGATNLEAWGGATLLGLAIFATNLSTLAKTWYIKYFNVLNISISNVLGQCSRLPFYLLTGYFSLGALGLILSETISRFVMLFPYIYRIKPFLTIKEELRPATCKEVYLKNKSNTFNQMPSQLIDSFTYFLPFFLIIFSFGGEAGGYFAFAQRIVYVPIALISRNLSDVFLAEAYQIRKESPRYLRAFFLKNLLLLCLISVSVIMSFFLFSTFVFDMIFAHSWQAANSLVKAVALVCIVRIAFYPLYSIMIILDKQRIKLLYDVLVVVTYLLLSWGCMTLKANLLTFVIVNYLGQAVLGGFFILISVIYLRRFENNYHI
jgi:O-antigen/teichoic acid export membrane protein